MQFEQSTGCALLRLICKIKADKSFFCATKWFLLHRQGRMWLSVTQYYSDLYSGFQFYISRKKNLVPAQFWTGDLCVLGERDNDYTTGTNWEPSPLPSGNIIPPSTLLWIWDWQQQHKGQSRVCIPSGAAQASTHAALQRILMHRCTSCTMLPVHRDPSFLSTGTLYMKAFSSDKRDRCGSVKGQLFAKLRFS